MKRSKSRRKKRIFNIWIGGGIGMRKNEALERDGGAFVIAERRDGGDQKFYQPQKWLVFHRITFVGVKNGKL